MYLFHEPHDGVSGCPKPLDEHVKRVCDNMNGCRMSVAAAVTRLSDAAPERVSVKPHFDGPERKSGWIGMTEGSLSNPPMHSWRLIKFKE